MKKVTVIFPMAGEGQRFGNKFKPFLKIFNKTFIEMAVEPFIKHEEQIKKFIFIIRDDHRRQFNVVEKLAELNISVPSSIVIVEPTKNVIETISPLFDENKNLRDVIFCDCDHWLDVDSIFEAIEKDEYDCIIPGWQIKPEESKSWSIAAVNAENDVTAIAEKTYPVGADKFYGVIGCYYFKRLVQPDSSKIKYLSDVVSLFTTNGKIKLIPVKKAEFFGDPQRLEKLYISKNASTIFCDLDGTIIKHENVPDYTKGLVLLDGAREKICEWRANHAFIVLTTSRDEQFRPEMEYMLREAGIKYEYLVMGLPPGPRYLINDKKPYSEVKMAEAIQVERNIGIASIGHSFASFDVKNNIGHKSLPLNAPKYQVDKFRAQYDSMLKIRNKIGPIVPLVSNFSDSGFDIEYMEGYKPLNNCENKEMALRLLFQRLRTLYIDRVQAHDSWLDDFLQAKIISKRDIARELKVDYLISMIMEKAHQDYKLLSPNFLAEHFHGDLTFENILIKNTDIKLIDLDNDNKPGPVELDLGKLMQSTLTGYESWNDNKYFIVDQNIVDQIYSFYGGILGPDMFVINKKAKFYCAVHLFRMIPYQAKHGNERVQKAADYCKKILNTNGTF